MYPNNYFIAGIEFLLNNTGLSAYVLLENFRNISDLLSLIYLGLLIIIGFLIGFIFAYVYPKKQEILRLSAGSIILIQMIPGGNLMANIYMGYMMNTFRGFLLNIMYNIISLIVILLSLLAAPRILSLFIIE